MFNFLFDGKIGDILAPIQSPIQQFHLAIQHHRNNEVEQLILSGTIELGNISNCGYADIHVACRYNNIHILNILLRRGIPVTHLDKYGNTPLHYAAKYGNIDICRILIDASASPAVRNSQGQSAYDMSDNHIVRQYLLPLQLACEREMNPGNNTLIPPPPTSLGSGFLPTTSTVNYPPPPLPPNGIISSGVPIYSPPPPPLPSVISATPITITSNFVPPPSLPHTIVNAPPSPNSRHDVNYSSSNPPTPSQVANNTNSTSSSPASISATIARPTVFVNTSTTLPGVPVSSNNNNNNNNNSPILNDSIQTQQQLSPSTSSNELQDNNSTTIPPSTTQWNSGSIAPAPSSGGLNSTSRRIIQPDGFESSASKIALKEKYGHTKVVNNVAPPPIFGTYAPPPVAIGGQQPPSQQLQSQSIYSPPVQSVGNLAPPNIYQPPLPNSTPSYLQNRYVAYDPNAPPNPYGQSNQSNFPPPQQQQQQYQQQINTFQYPSTIQIPVDHNTYSSPPIITQQFQPPTPFSPPPPPTITNINLTESISEVNIPGTTRLNPSPRIHVNADNVIFNPSTDRVVSATSTSSAIL